MSNIKPLQKWLLTKPFVSTLLVAAILAICWTLIWFAVLLILTAMTGTSTAGNVLVGGLLLSTVAEAIVRVMENSAVARKYSHGDLNPPEGQQSLWWATTIFLATVLVLIVLFSDSYLDAVKSLNFEYASDERGGITNMAPEWFALFFSSPFMILSLVVCLVLRTYIYKKRHRTNDWNKCKEYLVP